MNNEDYLKKEHIPVISTKQLSILFSDFILWYDKEYCKGVDGAMEVVGQYMKTLKVNTHE